MNPWTVRIVLFVCALQLFIQSAMEAHGEVWRSKELNCEIALPSSAGWVSIPLPSEMTKAAVQNKSKGEVLLLGITDAPADGPTLDRFVPGFKKGLLEEGGASRDQTEESLTVDGRPAYGFSDTATLNGTDLHRTHLVVLDGGRVYQLAAMSRTGNPLDDPDVESAFKGFHFLGQATTPPPLNPDNLSKLIGRITFYVLVGIVVVFLIVKSRSGSKGGAPGK